MNIITKMETINNQTQNMEFYNLQKPEPTQTQERIEVLDVIRGIALLGILIANMSFFSSPALYLEVLGINLWTGFWNETTTSFINLFVQGKFYSIFSFLFGLGFAIFFERAIAKTTRPNLLFNKRLLILLGFGLFHAFFVWYGDVLVTYALVGFLLPLFFYRKPKTLLIWVFSLFVSLIIVSAIVFGAIAILKSTDEAILAEVLQPFFANIQNSIDSSFAAYSQGTFAEIMTQRTADTLFIYSQIFASVFIILPLFLLGLYAGKTKIFQNIETNLNKIKKICIWSFVIGFSMSVVKFWSKNMMAGDIFSFYSVSFYGAGIFGDTGLALFIISLIVLLYHKGRSMFIFKPLANVGRMALSNYLLQSIICTIIFYSYGFGLYGNVSPALSLVLVIFIFIFQIFISKYWLERFRFGPVEWIWRSGTYGKTFEMKK